VTASIGSAKRRAAAIQTTQEGSEAREKLPFASTPEMASTAAPTPEKLTIKTVRVSVIGEEGCGKSTFVQQFITGQSRLSKSAITFETERTLSSRIIKRDGGSTSSLQALPANRPEIVTRYDVHVSDYGASPVTNFMSLENAASADFVMICFNMYGDNISVLFQIILDLFKACHASSRPRPPFMLIGLNKNWEQTKNNLPASSQKDSKSNMLKPSENLCTVVYRILDLFQCKMNFVVLHADFNADTSGKSNLAIQNSGNLTSNFMPSGSGTAVDAFTRAMDEYEISRDTVQGSVGDSSLYRLYYNAQLDGLACTLKNSWTKDASVDVFILPDFVGIFLSCNLNEIPSKIFDVTKLRSLDLTDNPLMKLSDGFSTLPKLSVLNVSNTKLSIEPLVLVACTSLTDLNISRNSLSVASCLLNCVSLIRLDISDNACPVIIDAAVAEVRLSVLTHLNLSKTACASFDFISSLVSVTYLNLRETGIQDGSLFFLSKLQHLRFFDVSCNNLSDISVPVHVETVIVDNNKLKSVEITCFCSSSHHLAVLSLNNNKLTELPKQIWHVSSLRELSFAANSVSVLDFAFAFCGNRLTKFDADGNPFNLMPPAITDLLGNNKFSEACEMSKNSLPIIKLSVLSNANGPIFDSITKQLSRIVMIVNVQEKSSSSKQQWVKTLLVSSLNPPRLFFLSPENDSDSITLEARLKDKPYWDISHPTFKFVHESAGLRQFWATVTFGTKSGPGATNLKSDISLTSKTIDFFTAFNRHQWDQHFKALIKFHPKIDRQNIFFKSMPGFLNPSIASSNSKCLLDFSPCSNVASAHSISTRSETSLDKDLFKAGAPLQDSSPNNPIQPGAPSSTSTYLAESVGKSASTSEQHIGWKYNSVFISAPTVDLNFFLPFVANSDIVLINLADEFMTPLELYDIVSSIKFVSRRCISFIYVILEPSQYELIANALGERNDDVIKIILHRGGNDVLIDEVFEAIRIVSSQRLMEPFAEYFQSFLMGVIKNRPPWTETESMMIAFSELVHCVRTQNKSFDTLGKYCLSYLQDVSCDIQQFLFQTCEFFDKCGIFVFWNSHICDPILISDLDMVAHYVIIPLLHTARIRKQVLIEHRQQVASSSSNQVIFTPHERSLIWSTILSINPKLMFELDWAVVSLHIAGATFEVPPVFPADVMFPSLQPFQETLIDRSQSLNPSSTQKKEGWVHHEDQVSNSIKKQWFTCSIGPDGVSFLNWRNSETSVSSSSNQSIVFAKGTKTTVAQTKKNRAGWTHCCRIDHEDSRAATRKTQSTKIVMCFNNEKEMREWWSFIETSVAPRSAPVVPSTETRSPAHDSQSFNIKLTFKDDYVSKEESDITCLIENLDLCGREGGVSNVEAGSVSLAQPTSAYWSGCVLCVDAAAEYILRMLATSMSLYSPRFSSFCSDSTVYAIFKRSVSSVDDVSKHIVDTAVLSLKFVSPFTEITIVSSGYDCHIFVDILLEAIMRASKTGFVHTVSAITNVPSIAKNYGLSHRPHREYVPSVALLCLVSSSLSPSLPKLRRIVHLHSNTLTNSSKVIEEWAMKNNWEYSKYKSRRPDCILAAAAAAASERLVFILDIQYFTYRGR
jgi:hypothetical protein